MAYRKIGTCIKGNRIHSCSDQDAFLTCYGHVMIILNSKQWKSKILKEITYEMAHDPSMIYHSNTSDE